MTINLTDVNEPGTGPGTAHCNATERLEIWCASLTVGTGTLGGEHLLRSQSYSGGVDRFRRLWHYQLGVQLSHGPDKT